MSITKKKKPVKASVTLLSTVVFSVTYSITSTISHYFPNPSSIFLNDWFYYELSILSIISTYSIVILKTYSVSKILLNPLSILRNVNTIYLMISLIYFVNYELVFKNLQMSLLPFTIYSLFHSINYIINNNLTYNKETLIKFNEKYYQFSLNLAANLEFLINLQLILRNLINWSSFIIYNNKIIKFNNNSSSNSNSNFNLIINNIKLALITTIYLVFIKIRYNDSVYMKTIIENYDFKINQFLSSNNNKIPKYLISCWFKFRNFIISNLGNSIRIKSRNG